MRGRTLVCALLLALVVLPGSARADVIFTPWDKPPQPRAETAAFEALYGAQFVDFDPAYAGALDEETMLALWDYPGAPEPRERIRVRDYPVDHLAAYYEDGAGRFWGYVNYIYGCRYVWICLSDPAADDLGQPEDTALTSRIAEQVDAEAARLRMEDLKQKAWLAIPIGLVAALTLGLIFLPARRRRRR